MCNCYLYLSSDIGHQHFLSKMQECPKNFKNLRPLAVSLNFRYRHLFSFPQGRRNLTYLCLHNLHCFLLYLLCSHFSFTNKKWSIYLEGFFFFSIFTVVKCSRNFISELYSYLFRRSNFNLLELQVIWWIHWDETFSVYRKLSFLL